MAHIVRFDCYEVDLLAGQIYKRGNRVNLRDKSFQVLAKLLEHPGEVVSRESLRLHLWGNDVFVDFENNVNAAIAHLRDALEDSAEHPRFIETLPRRGYRFVAAVSVVDSGLARPLLPKPRLLVLPFLNLTGDSARDFFCDAMTFEIITKLATRLLDRVAVIARGISFHYKQSRKELERIGRDLNLDYFIEGEVLRAGDQVSVNVQVIQAEDLTLLFADHFEGAILNLFGLQDRIVDAIATHLPSPDDRNASQATSTVGVPLGGS